MEQELEQLAAETGHSKGFYVKEAFAEYHGDPHRLSAGARQPWKRKNRVPAWRM